MTDQNKTSEQTKPSDQNGTQTLNAGNEGTQKLVAPTKGGKLVKLEILRDCEVEFPDGSKTVKVKGDIVEVTESVAKTLLSFKVRGCYGFAGEREGDVQKQTLKKARIHKVQSEEDKKKSELEKLDEQVAS